jgi:proline dehydrogenase
MFRQVLSAVAGQPWLRKAIVSTPGVRDVAWRFVAGENLDAGLAVIENLNARGIKGTLNHIGTHVKDETEAVAAADGNIEALRRIGEQGLDANLSVKLTQIGLDIDEAFRQDLELLLSRGRHPAIATHDARLFFTHDNFSEFLQPREATVFERFDKTMLF